jgi:diguanylate cyclase (GGDEF)-like protein/PAS domain S-box-containing protein
MAAISFNPVQIVRQWRRRLGIVLIVACLSGSLLAVQSAATRKVISNNFASLERGQGERSIEQARKALEADLNQLAISVHDYAVWDYAYDFAATRDPGFVRSNLTVETLENSRVDIVWMIDSHDKDILALQLPTGSGEQELTPADGTIIQAMRPKVESLAAHPGSSGLERLFQTSHGPLAVAANPILPSSGQGASRGILVFARFLNQAAVDRAQSTSQLPLQLYIGSSATTTLPEPAIALWSSDRSAPNTVLVPTSESVLSGFALLRDVDGQPVAILGTRMQRQLSAFGRETGRSLVAIFSGVIAVFAAIVSGLLLYLDKIGKARAASERRYRAVITQAQETMLLVDTLSRQILEANPAATQTLGFSTVELMGMDVDELFYACDGDVLKPVHAAIHAASRLDRILLVRCKNKDFIDVEVTASPLTVDEREVTSFVLRNVSARKRAERQLVHNQDQLVHLAHHDALTGLLNRLGLERRLPDVLKLAAERRHWAALFYIDLDHFKKINDLRGHACGDRLLQIAAERLRNCLSSEDLVVRMGGDEFVVIASGLRERASAESIATRICTELAVPFEVDAQYFKVTASLGVSIYPQDGADYDVLLKNADIALYESKEAGRATYTLFTSEMTQRVTERLAFEVELRDAIELGQLYVDYQPLVDPRTQQVASLEALVRWHHPIRGRVSPAQFIPIAERTGQICEIGDFVIREVCRQISEWQRAGARLVPVAVNVSSKQLEQRDIVDVVKDALSTTQVSPAQLRIEITESVFMDSSGVRVQHLNEIRELGIQVSMDDFGTGFSNLAYLKHLPVDCLKIDRAFVKDIHAAGADEAIVKAIIGMAHSLGMSTVAEGVETQEQARRLCDLGATYIQGFYYSPPVAADICGRMLRGSDTNSYPRLPASAEIATASESHHKAA